METSKIRDRLLEQRALYVASVQRAESAAKRINELIASVSEEDAQIVLNAIGFDYGEIRAFDLERMKTDTEYLEECEVRLEEVITALHEYLEGALNV